MLFTTLTQYVVLAIMLVVGWLFGLASHPGGRKWQDKYRAETAAYTDYRRDSEARARDQDKRIAELEREKLALEKQRVVATPVAAVAPVANRFEERPVVMDRPVATSAGRPAYDDGVVRPVGAKRGWFEFDRR